MFNVLSTFLFQQFWTIWKFSNHSTLRQGISQVNFCVSSVSIQLYWIYLLMILPSFGSNQTLLPFPCASHSPATNVKWSRSVNPTHTTQQMMFAGMVWPQHTMVCIKEGVSMGETWRTALWIFCWGELVQLQWNLRCKYWFTPLVQYGKLVGGCRYRVTCPVCEECVVTIRQGWMIDGDLKCLIFLPCWRMFHIRIKGAINLSWQLKLCSTTTSSFFFFFLL